MANAVRLKRSAVSGKVPSVADLDLGEIAINTHDGKLFIKKDDGTPAVVEVGGGGGSGVPEPVSGDAGKVLTNDGSAVFWGAPVLDGGEFA